MGCTLSRPGVFSDLAQRDTQRGPQPASGGRGEVAGQAGAGGALVLEDQLDPQVPAPFAVIDHGHRPGHPGPLRVAGGMVVEREVDGLFHAATQPEAGVGSGDGWGWGRGGWAIAARGSSTRKVAPSPGVLSTSTLPP